MENNQLVKQSFDLAAPEQAIHVASVLQKFVQEQRLTVDIQSRPYVLVEGWQFAGAQFGLYPILVDIKNESTYEDVTFRWSDRKNNPKEKSTQRYKYRANVEIKRFLDDKVVSRGEMVCTNEESGKHEFAEYAIQSMAQTRAEGKAWRMLLGWVMKAAGFETMPFEEMDEDRKEFLENCPTPEEKKELIKLAYTAKLDEDKRVEAFATIAGCTTYELFKRIEDRLRSLQPSIDEIVNPSQNDIKKHVGKVAKQPA